MPKMKTHKGAAKRFKVTATGKFTRRKVGLNHRVAKPDRRVLDEVRPVSKPDIRRLKRLLPYAR